MSVPNPGGAENWAAYPRWATVYSSNVVAIRFEGNPKDDSWGKVLVQFKGARSPIYHYSPVSKKVAIAFYKAESQGKFVHRYLKRFCSVKGPF